MKNSQASAGSVSAFNYVYLMPAFILITVFFIMSTVFTVYVSFFQWDGFGPMNFIGVRNYIAIFRDPNFLRSLANTLIWVGCALILNCLVPLLLALLITNSSFLSYFKYIFYLPSALAGAVVGIIMKNLLVIHGLPTLLATLLKFPKIRSEWLATPYVNTYIMIIMGIWGGIGLNMVYRICSGCLAATLALLAQIFISLQDCGPQTLPAFILVLLRVHSHPPVVNSRQV